MIHESAGPAHGRDALHALDRKELRAAAPVGRRHEAQRSRRIQVEFAVRVSAASASRNSRLPRLSCLALVDIAPAECSDDLSSHSHLCRCDCGRTWHRSTGNGEEGDPRCRGLALVFPAADTAAGRATGSIPSVQGIAGGVFRWSRRAYGVRRRIRACWPMLPLRVYAACVHACVIGYFAKISSARLKALSIACSGVIPLFMTSSMAMLKTCSASICAIAGLNA